MTKNTLGRDSQQVLKAEGASLDATACDVLAMTSPGVGPMGAWQPADAGPFGGTFTSIAPSPSRPMLEMLAEVEYQMSLLCPMPPSEMRLHPDDIDEIRARFPGAPSRQASAWGSVTIIPDAEAPRLPRIKGGTSS